MLFALAILLLTGHPLRAQDATASAVTLTGKIARPGPLTLDALRKLPAQQVQVSFQSERGTTNAAFTGAPLWSVLQEAGGLTDTEKSGPLHHTLKVSGRDGYFVIFSTGELAPDFGGEQAILAYQQNDQKLGGTGFRLVMPGDKLGGRNVRDVVAIDVE